MRSAMMELAELCGYNFEASTFPELILFYVLAMCGTAILASIVKVLFWLAFNTHKIAR